MRIAFHTVIVSPHQIPFAEALINRIGCENFRYVYTELLHAERATMGWPSTNAPWILSATSHEARRWLETADIVVSGLRNFKLFEYRSSQHLKTFYCSERWFKPPYGMLRMVHPRYFQMVRRLIHLAKSSPYFFLLPIGVQATRDFRNIGIPLSKMTTWGYFVSPGCRKERQLHSPLRVLWVGRMLRLKHVETIIKAVANCRNVSLTLVGDGQEKNNLMQIAANAKNGNVIFMPLVPIDQIRSLMRSHDVYVFSSNGYDGWGAVVSEALEEGMRVVGTYESGAPATLLPNSCLFHCGDWKTLRSILSNPIPYVGIGDWTAEKAAERLLKL